MDAFSQFSFEDCDALDACSLLALLGMPLRNGVTVQPTEPVPFGPFSPWEVRFLRTNAKRLLALLSRFNLSLNAASGEPAAKVLTEARPFSLVNRSTQTPWHRSSHEALIASLEAFLSRPDAVDFRLLHCHLLRGLRRVSRALRPETLGVPAAAVRVAPAPVSPVRAGVSCVRKVWRALFVARRYLILRTMHCDVGAVC
jgi:hypothetical protein